MVRSFFKPVLSLCLIVAAGYGTYLPFEIIRSHQIEEASRPLVVNALSAELMSQAAENATAAAKSAEPAFGNERIIQVDPIQTGAAVNTL